MREAAGAPTDALLQPALELLHRARAAARIAAVMQAIAAGSACAAAVIALAAVAGWLPKDAQIVALGCGATIATTFSVLFWHRCTMARAALSIESGAPHLHNLLVTVEQLSRRRAHVHPLVAGEIGRQTSAALADLDFRVIRAVRGSALFAAVMACGALVLTSSVSPEKVAGRSPGEDVAVALSSAIGTLTVQVTPPRYSGRAAFTLRDPAQVRVLEGSQIVLEVAGGAADLSLVEPAGSATSMTRQGSTQTLGFPARETMFYLVRATGDSTMAPRVLALIVEADERPAVRILAPARDLALTAPDVRISVAIDATDDLGLADLSLRYTHVAGSGETFAFKEGVLPIRLEQQTSGHWRATSELPLPSLGLKTGDTLVYRAVARDRKPGGAPSASDTYLVEIGSVTGISSEGFALPAEKDRHAISQQMVIVKTERLLASWHQVRAAALLEQSRLLAVEQRMVRAEFVFMTGGEVEDEAEEAAHSHDLVEGRFENEGTRELLVAVREMSRAEAALNEASLAEALVLERSALQALQRAFDRRRYFLKTVPERARIDASRRLTGERRDAHSTSREIRGSTPPDQLNQLRAISEALARHTDPKQGRWAEIATRVAAIAPTDSAMQAVALRLAAAESVSRDERRTIAGEALRLLAARLRAGVGPAPTSHLSEHDLLGHFANERPQPGSTVPRRWPGGS